MSRFTTALDLSQLPPPDVIGHLGNCQQRKAARKQEVGCRKYLAPTEAVDGLPHTRPERRGQQQRI
jgi:hypothetical protein